jgi:hypothetical protein
MRAVGSSEMLVSTSSPNGVTTSQNTKLDMDNTRAMTTTIYMIEFMQYTVLRAAMTV